MMDSITPDRYGLLHFHDQGGIGWVYVANDSEVNRKVALKCLQPQVAIDPEARSRFFREAAITSTLEHPGVVPVYGVGGNDPDRLPYYAMRFVQGTTMKDAIRQLHSGPIEKWSTGTAYQLLRSLINVCDTVAFAHSRNIIHRDLKSANIMLGEYGETLLLDWGLAKRIHEPDVGATKQSANDASIDSLQATRSGSTIGTIAFMSPEQALGNWSEVDFQSDQFSLGAILYQILTGQVPYKGSQSLLLAQRAEYAPPISVLTTTPSPLNAICCKAMAKAKSDRYASVEAFKKDIEGFLADEPIVALPDNILTASQRWLRKHRTLAQVTGFLLMLTSLILVGFLAQLARQNEDLERAIDSERQAKIAVEESNRVVKSLLVESQQEAYQAQMLLASQSWNAMHPKRLEQALFNAQPKVGSFIDPRGPEWWLAWHRAFGDVTPMALGSDKDPIEAIRLIADARRAALWTRSRRLRIIDLSTKAELFAATLSSREYMLSIWNADEIPVSEDGSTIAIAKQSTIQLWRWDGQSYVSQDSLLSHSSYRSAWTRICLSANGETIAAINQSQEVAIWKNTKQVKLPWNNYRAEKICLSESGSMVAMLQEKTVSIVRLDTEELKTFPKIFDAKPTKIAFGEWNTLIAWNKQSAITWYIHLAPFEAIHLWEYPLPRPPVGAFEWACLREKIVFENAFRVDRVGHQPDWLVDRGRVRTSILACMDKTDARVFIREPAKSFALKEELLNPDLLKDRIREFPVPQSTQIRSMTFNFKSAAVKIGEEQWGISNIENQLQSWNDPFSFRGPVHQVSWFSERDLIAVSEAAEFPPFVAHSPGQRTAPELAKVSCRPSFVNAPSIQLKGYQCCVSENGRIAASYEKKTGIHVVDNLANEPKKPFDVDATLTFIGDRAIRMHLWNRWEQSNASSNSQPEIDFDVVAGQPPQDSLAPLNLPWLLMYQNGSWGDPMDEVLEERLRLLIVDYEKRTLVDILEIDDDKVQAVAISSDGRQLIVATEDMKLHIWEVGDDKKISKRIALDSPSRVKSLFVHSPFQVFIGTEQGDILRINHEYKVEEWLSNAHDSSIECISSSPDQSRLVTLGSDRLVRIWDVRDRREVFALSMASEPTCVSFSPQQSHLAVGDSSGRIHVFPLATSDQVIAFEQKYLRAQPSRSRSEEAIARELWAGNKSLSTLGDLQRESARQAIDMLKPKFAELSLPELWAKVQEAIQHSP